LKLNIFLNNHFPNYNKKPINDIKHINLKHVKRALKLDNCQYILRGEPTLYPYLYEVLDALQGKDFILTTSGFNPEILINYKGKIPYLVLNFDGFLNDKLRNSLLTNNILKLLDHFGNRSYDTITRICYTISKMNLPWLKVDAEILIKFYELYPNLKKPYFVIYQQAEMYNQDIFTWVGMGMESVKLLNHKGLLSEKNLAYMNAWLKKEDYICSSPQDELVISYDGKFKTCMSMRFIEEIGDIETMPLNDIISSTKELRKNCEQCHYRQYCWLAFHYKDNIIKE